MLLRCSPVGLADGKLMKGGRHEACVGREVWRGAVLRTRRGRPGDVIGRGGGVHVDDGIRLVRLEGWVGWRGLRMPGRAYIPRISDDLCSWGRGHLVFLEGERRVTNGMWRRGESKRPGPGHGGRSNKRKCDKIVSTRVTNDTQGDGIASHTRKGGACEIRGGMCDRHRLERALEDGGACG